VKHLGVYRVATYLLVLFCLGHTGGGMLSQKSLGPEADAVLASMKAVHFDFNGATCTYHGFWLAFGLTASVFLAFSAIVAWSLDGLKAAEWARVAPIAWALCASHAANAVLSWRYFFAGPGVFATLITLLLGIGAVRSGRAATAAVIAGSGAAVGR
jgi:hypothetical protein